MRHDFLDRYSRLESPIHRLHPVAKLVSALVLVILTVTFPFRNSGVFLILFGFLLIVIGISLIPWRFVFGRLLALEPFALGVALLALFQQGGISIFLGILVKSSLCLLTMILLSNTTPFSELLT